MYDDFGWLDQRGNYYPVAFEDHESWATAKVIELGLVDETNVVYGRCGDLLVQQGWVLIHNPCCDGSIPYVEGCIKPRTKAQREFLFDYYSERNRPDLAQRYFEDPMYECL